MKKKITQRVLILGDIESIYVKSFITRFLQPCGFDVDVKTNLGTPERKKRCCKVANELGVKLIEKSEDQITKHLKLLPKTLSTSLKGVLYLFYKIQSKIRGEYDFVHVHYIYYEVLRNAWRYKTSKSKMIASWWGSDLFRKNDAELEKCWRYLKNFNLVTTDSIDLEEAYFERVVKNQSSTSAYRRLYLGSEIADSIDSHIGIADRVLNGNVVAADKVIIAIGYNASKAQQHLEVIKALSKISSELKNRIIVLLQMTYGIEDNNYIEEVSDKVNEAGFETIIFDKYLSNEDVANIRICSDIFINAQVTDAFCSTIKEYMFAKTVLVNARWLEYKEIQEWGLQTEVFEDFCELQKIVERIMERSEVSYLEKNRDVIRERFTWDRCAEKWNAAYSSI